MDAAAGAPIPAPSDAGQGTAAAFPIAIVIAIGFMVTTLILISYYFLVVRCWLRGGGASGLLHRARREDDRGGLAERVSAVFFADHDAAELPGGLDPDVVAALPVVRYYRRRARSASECAVCLGEFAPGERLKLLPGCSHAFHIDCIDTWLQGSARCPFCRSDVTLPAIPSARRAPAAAAAVLPTSRRRDDALASESIVIEVRGERERWFSSSHGTTTTPRRQPPKQQPPLPRCSKAAESVGDEAIDTRKTDAEFAVQPLRRSVSLDSSCGKHLYVSIQELLATQRQVRDPSVRS